MISSVEEKNMPCPAELGKFLVGAALVVLISVKYVLLPQTKWQSICSQVN